MTSPQLTKECTWAIRGVVVHGHGRGGTQLGFPTANVGLDDETTNALLPLQNWVYFGFGTVEGAVPPAVLPLVMSVGFNPHFQDKRLTVEAYFLHKFPQDFYGATVRIISCGAIREQGAFTTLDDLIKTIRHDCDVATAKLLEPSFQFWAGHAFLSADAAVSKDFVQPNVPSVQVFAWPSSL
jgi:riboflavin kinase